MAFTSGSGQFHAVRFYEDASSLAGIVCAFVAEGLRLGEPAIVIATAEHTRLFRDGLATRGVDTPAAVVGGSLTLLDAEETLAKFMRDGIPMAKPFADTLTPLLASIAARFPGAAIRAYGEMVDVLWKREQVAAAIRIENLWNDLARSHRFGLLCGYAMGNFYKGSATNDICRVHTHVVTDSAAMVPLA